MLGYKYFRVFFVSVCRGVFLSLKNNFIQRLVHSTTLSIFFSGFSLKKSKVKGVVDAGVVVMARRGIQDFFFERSFLFFYPSYPYLYFVRQSFFFILRKMYNNPRGATRIYVNIYDKLIVIKSNRSCDSNVSP